jgi:hypothetical protein
VFNPIVKKTSNSKIYIKKTQTDHYQIHITGVLLNYRSLLTYMVLTPSSWSVAAALAFFASLFFLFLLAAFDSSKTLYIQYINTVAGCA